MNIIDFTFDNQNNLYTLNDYYLISKIKIEQNYNMIYPLTLGLLTYFILKNPLDLNF